MRFLVCLSLLVFCSGCALFQDVDKAVAGVKAEVAVLKDKLQKLDKTEELIAGLKKDIAEIKDDDLKKKMSKKLDELAGNVAEVKSDVDETHTKVMAHEKKLEAAQDIKLTRNNVLYMIIFAIAIAVCVYLGIPIAKILPVLLELLKKGMSVLTKPKQGGSS